MDEAEKILNNYFATFPKVKEYIEKCQRFVDRHGMIVDMVGRIRRFKNAGYDVDGHEDFYETWFNRRTGLRSPKPQFRSWIGGDRRAATNHPIQALAASMTKIGAVEMNKMFLEHGLDAEIIEYIHDEVLVTCTRDKKVIEEVLQIVREAMVNKLDMASYCIPNHPLGWTWPPYLDMDVEIKVGDSYGSLMDPDKYLAQFKAEELLLQEMEKVDTLDDDEEEVR